MRTMERLPVACLCLLLSCSAVVSRVDVVEGSDAILPCSLNTKEDIRSKMFDWRKDPLKDVFLYDAGSHYNNGLSGQDEQFKGRVFHFSEELQHGNASITIRKTKVADSGKYTCDFPRLQPRQTSHIELVVAPILKDRSAENLPGAAPKPSVTIVKTNIGSLLQCEVHGASPKPEVEWRDSSGNILPAKELKVTKTKDYYDIILQATVTKTDTYRCVSTQEEIYHRTETEIYAHNGGSTGWHFHGFLTIVIIVAVGLLCIFVGYSAGMCHMTYCRTQYPNAGSTSTSQREEVALNGSGSYRN